MTETITRIYARFAAETDGAVIPTSVRHDARRAILNNLAAAYGGCRDAAADAMLAVIVPLSGPPIAPVVGRTEMLDYTHAAWINAAIANVLDFDDTHLPTVIHPTSPIAPALFAYAEKRAREGRPVTGSDLIDAFAIGVDIACRIGNAISPGHYDRGWHITGTCGVFGAAAGVSRLMGLDADRTAWALANAATQAGGLVETLGFHSKSLNPANAARNGLLSALLAEAGLSGPPAPIEGVRGFLRVLSDKTDPAPLTQGLGETWELSKNALKPYPCGVVLHPVIDACLDLHARHALDPATVARITVRGNSLLKARADRQVSTGREAQVCLSHSVAVALALGRAGVTEYTDALVNDPAIRALGDKVAMQVDDSVPVEAAGVAIALSDGRSLEAYVPHARGSLGRPLTDAEIEEKLRTLASLNAPAIDTERLVATVWSLDDLADASLVFRQAALPKI
ncbi:MAG: MmgE/PrpD family protein [Hyphomicrobiaceae bacterium]